MDSGVRFAVIGDCHYSTKGNYGTRDCLNAKSKLADIIDKLNAEDLDFVFSLGDLGNGDASFEVPEMLEVYAKSRHTVKFCAGNHDLCPRSDVVHMQLVNNTEPMYDFVVKGYRFIVLNPFEMSRYSAVAEDREFYWNFRKNNPDIPVQEWPGLFRETSWQRLENMLNEATKKGEQVIILCHVPVWHLACPPAGNDPPARIVEHERMLELLDKYPNLRAYIAGHFHPGGLDVRNGVMHKTVRAVCDFKENTYCIITADSREIAVKGFGMESDYVHKFF